MSASSDPAKSRIVSLDQFRGYTIAGMFLVNFLGDYASMPQTLGHHGNYCSYADTIMPQFLFAVGYAFRYTFRRALEKHGVWPAYRKAIKRNLGLILFGMVFYGVGTTHASWAELRDAGAL